MLKLALFTPQCFYLFTCLQVGVGILDTNSHFLFKGFRIANLGLRTLKICSVEVKLKEELQQ